MKHAAGFGLVMALLCTGASMAADKPKPTAAAKAPAAPAPTTALNDAQRRDVELLFKNLVMPRFTVQADDELDDEMRAAAQAMQAEHLPRVQSLMMRWALEEVRQPEPQRWLSRMMARLVNEFALWGRDSTGSAQDEALALSLQTSGMCRPVGARPSELVMRLARFRGLPPDVRRTAVRAERELLGRWGQPRQVDESEPLEPEDALLTLRASGKPPGPLLPPVLAQLYLGDSEATRQDPWVAEPAVRCAMHQWAGARPAPFRAAMAMQAADVVGRDRRKAAAPISDAEPYPQLARLFDVRGVITLRGVVSPEGRLLQPTVVEREIKVPGLRNERAFAFEGLLDLATLAKARDMDWKVWAPATGTRVFEREFEWSLP